MGIRLGWVVDPEHNWVDVTVCIGDGSGADAHTIRLEPGFKLRVSWQNRGDATTTAVDVECADPAAPDPVNATYHGLVKQVAFGENSTGLLASADECKVGRLDVAAHISAHSERLWIHAPGTGVRFPRTLRTPAAEARLARDALPPPGWIEPSSHQAATVEPPRAGELGERGEEEVG